MSDSSFSVCSILDFPDEILVKIILHFDARERLALANSCQRFNDLVFGDGELLRNLDFTGERQLTKESDIQLYFNNEKTYKKILRINTECVEAIRNLSSSIGKAINLVELNILRGLHFDSVEELSRFLKPLVHLKRLSFNWPASSMQTNYDNPEWNQVLKEPFSRLTYLSLNIYHYTNQFLLNLQLCQQLEELRMSITSKVEDSQSPLRQDLIKLSNLQFFRLISGSRDLALLRKHIMCIVPDPAEWTDFHVANPWDAIIYLGRNPEVCPELSRVKEMSLPDYVLEYRSTYSIDRGWTLVTENLLSEVIRVTHDDSPKKFCCLSSHQSPFIHPCTLEIDEAKKLLKDPRYQISCLKFYHVIERNCDVHLLASAFPNLTKLVLFRIGNRNSMLAPESTKPLRRRLSKKRSVASEEDSDARNEDSSFKMLVENTPRLKVLKISPHCRQDSPTNWDLDALDLISGWKNLTVLRLYDVPIRDGDFLIDIGKECKKLEEIWLIDVGHNCSYESKLLQMLHHCEELRKLGICGMRLNHMSEMFDILSHRSKLECLELGNRIEEYNFVEVVTSFEKMLRDCQKLNDVLADLSPLRTFEVLGPAMDRIVEELNRPNFDFSYTQSDNQ